MKTANEKNVRVVELTIQDKDEKGVKTNLGWMRISKYSAFTLDKFVVGETYKAEVETYEYDGFLRERILRLVK